MINNKKRYGNQKKILIYSDCNVFGGSEKLILYLVRSIQQEGQFKVFFVFRKHKIYTEALENEFSTDRNRNHIALRILSNDSLFYKISLLKINILFKKILKLPLYFLERCGIYFILNFLTQLIVLIRISPDIVHINNGGYPGAKSCSTMVASAKILKIENILYQINNVAQKQHGPIDVIYDKYIGKNVAKFITASNNSKLTLVQERNFNINKIILLPNTVLVEKVLLSRNAILTNLGIGENNFILCNVGFLSKRKGQKYLLEAINIIKITNPEAYSKIRVLLIGDGEEEAPLKKYVTENDLSSVVYFLGYQKHSIDYINACDVFVFPSVAGEDMPLVILTSMSLKKFIIATDFAGISEEIENGKSGKLIPLEFDNFAQSLADSIVEQYNSKNPTYGYEAFKRYNELFSNKIYNRKISNIYENLVSGR